MTNTQTAEENSRTQITDEAPKRYVIAKDGNTGTETRHLNFSNPEVCPTEGIITLQPMKSFTTHEMRHKSNVSFSVFRDKKDDIIVGIPRKFDNKTGEWQYQKLRLQGTEVLDLSIKANREKWAVIRLSSFLEGSPNAKGKPLYKVTDNMAQAKKFLETFQNKRKAEELAFGMEGEQLTNMARVLGIAVEQNTKETLKVEVIKSAQNKPDDFLKILNSPTFKHSVIFKKAVLFGLIEQDHLNGFTYRGVPMGQMAHTESGAILWLADHVDTSNAIDVQCLQRENPVVKEINEAPTSNINDEKDVKIAEMMAQNKRLLEALEKSSAEKLKDPVDEELEQLRKDAKAVGVKSPHLYDDKAKLRDLIEKESRKA